MQTVWNKSCVPLSYAAMNAGISLKVVKSRRFHRKLCGHINEIGVWRIVYNFELYQLPGVGNCERRRIGVVRTL
jgi:hypothetical protein